MVSPPAAAQINDTKLHLERHNRSFRSNHPSALWLPPLLHCGPSLIASLSGVSITLSEEEKALHSSQGRAQMVSAKPSDQWPVVQPPPTSFKVPAKRQSCTEIQRLQLNDPQVAKFGKF